MQYVQFSELRARCKLIFDRVESGERVLVTRHGRPIAEIIPYEETLLPCGWKRNVKKIKIKGESISNTVIKERRESD